MVWLQLTHSLKAPKV